VTKEVRFFIISNTYVKAKELKRVKKKKKETLNPKPYIPLSHISLGAKNT
jgi:hypothetical protein